VNLHAIDSGKRHGDVPRWGQANYDSLQGTRDRDYFPGTVTDVWIEDNQPWALWTSDIHGAFVVWLKEEQDAIRNGETDEQALQRMTTGYGTFTHLPTGWNIGEWNVIENI
jgi:hypothetical protein